MSCMAIYRYNTLWSPTGILYTHRPTLCKLTVHNAYFEPYNKSPVQVQVQAFFFLLSFFTTHTIPVDVSNQPTALTFTS